MYRLAIGWAVVALVCAPAFGQDRDVLQPDAGALLEATERVALPSLTKDDPDLAQAVSDIDLIKSEAVVEVEPHKSGTDEPSVLQAVSAIDVIESKVVAEVAPHESGFGYVMRQERKLWSGQFAFGLNGAEGNTERFNSRFGYDGKRSGPKNDLTLNMTYAKSTADGEETENKFLSDARNEWKLDETPWNLFVSGSGVYDEFQAWDFRLVTNAGVGYKFIDEETTKLSTRFGSGTSREFGGTDNRFIPEANFAMDAEKKLNDRHSLKAGLEYFPSFFDFGDYRVNSKTSWEILIDPEWKLSLRLGLQDRFQSMPDGGKRNDLDYFAEIVWKY